MAKYYNLNKLLKDKTEDVKQAAADVLNAAADEIVSQMQKNMNASGIQNRTGKLRGGIEIKKATTENISVMIKNEVVSDKEVKKPGKFNPAMKGRYKGGVPYGRLLEFAPRFKGKYSFFYKSWYEKRNKVKKEIMEKIGNAWSD